MQSSRESGHVEILMPCQVRDPGRGSFMVHPLAVKNGGQFKMIRNPNWDGIHHSQKNLPVMRAAHHIKGYDNRTGAPVMETHPEAFDFAVDYTRRVT